MPELPEVEVVKQSLEKYIVNKNLLKIIVKNNNLRFPVPKNLSKKLSNIKIKKIKRISKYIVIEFYNDLFLIVHLGMSGTLHLTKNINFFKNTNLSFYHSKNLPKKHNHIFFKFKKFLIIYNDPRRFGFVNLVKGKINLKSYFSKLGPDPFSEAYNFNYVKKYFYNKRKNIKNITSDFIFNFDDELFQFNELKIAGIDKKISDQYLNKFNSEKKDIFNKVIFRNTVKDFFKIISLD